jgi:hypothetical protein
MVAGPDLNLPFDGSLLRQMIGENIAGQDRGGSGSGLSLPTFP